MPVRAAQLHFDSRLGFVLLHREPLEIAQFIAPTADQRFSVIDLPARAGAAGVPVGRAWMQPLEFGPKRR